MGQNYLQNKNCITQNKLPGAGFDAVTISIAEQIKHLQ